MSYVLHREDCQLGVRFDNDDAMQAFKRI